MSVLLFLFAFQKGQLGRVPAELDEAEGACSSSHTNGQSSRSNDSTDGLWYCNSSKYYVRLI